MLLPLHVTDWPERYRELFEERAAIIEYLANRDRREAERTAELAVRKIAREEDRWEHFT